MNYDGWLVAVFGISMQLIFVIQIQISCGFGDITFIRRMSEQSITVKSSRPQAQ